eukprot:jgi/Mesvir1/10553/Mv21780-RA.1
MACLCTLLPRALSRTSGNASVAFKDDLKCGRFRRQRASLPRHHNIRAQVNPACAESVQVAFPAEGKRSDTLTVGAGAMTGRRDMVRLLALVGLTSLASVSNVPLVLAENVQYKKATFAGGCFWCMEPPFDKTEGVISTTSGYTGGEEPNPTYREVSAGVTGHAESVEVLYDPTKVTYEQLLDVYWHQVNPTTRDRQFCDYGHQYRTAIFYRGEEEKAAVLASLDKYKAMGVFRGNIVTEILPAGDFWPAEEYHQDYYKKNPQLYNFYRSKCGRDEYLESIWGDGAASKVNVLLGKFLNQGLPWVAGAVIIGNIALLLRGRRILLEGSENYKDEERKE